jgi:hypothetical protein
VNEHLVTKLGVLVLLLGQFMLMRFSLPGTQIAT